MFKRSIVYVDKEGFTCGQTMSDKAIQNLAVAIKQNLKKCSGKFTATDIGLYGATMRVACQHGLAKVVGSNKSKLILPYGEGVIEVETNIYTLTDKPEKMLAELKPLFFDRLRYKAILYRDRADRAEKALAILNA